MLYSAVVVLCYVALASSLNVVQQGDKIFKPTLGWVPNGSKAKHSFITHDIVSVPDSFDSRDKWTNCKSIGQIQNQARCGSCWAFGAVEAITDRFCIQKGQHVQLSFQDMVTCDDDSDGCNGGDAFSAWDWVKKDGIVSDACSPYTIPTCPPSQQPCMPDTFVDTPSCTRKCNSSTIDYKQDKHHISKVYGVTGVSNIQTEIMTNGPVEACFTVYEDFVSYRSGVYSHQSGDVLGGHCIKIIGWGIQDDVPYWIAANSWTPSWGNDGYFWIRRGTDECGIEDEVVAGTI